MVQVACIARTPEFVQLIEDLIVILLGTSRNFRWSAHRRSIVLGPYRSRARYLRNRTMLRKLVQAAARRFQSVAGFVRWSLNLWCPGAVCPRQAISMRYIGKPLPAAALTRKGFPAHWQTSTAQGATRSLPAR